MTRIADVPADFAEDQLDGFVAVYGGRLRRVTGGVVARAAGEPTVAVVVGGGSGHYPAFAGLVGPGFATGAVVGNIFTSPSAAHVYSVAKAAHRGRGVVLTFGNYAGDVMNFGIAADRLRAEGIDTRIVLVTDDVASAPAEDERRGIAGDFVVFKALGAAAAAGLDLDAVERAGQAANAATRTLGVAFSGCTMPGAAAPLFHIEPGMLGLGLGIHGEPGIRDVPMPTATGLAELLVTGVLEAAPRTGPARVGAILNGLGTTKYEELFLLWARVLPLLEAAELEVVEPEVGELVTSLDMGGCSLTLTWLDGELEPLWRADAYAPAYRKQAAPLAATLASAAETEDTAADETLAFATPSPAAAALAVSVAEAAELVTGLLRDHEHELGAIDAVAGDGDHGRGMLRGAEAALSAIDRTVERGAGAGAVLAAGGRAWAEQAGGTSGVLWGAALEAAGAALDDAAAAFSDDSAGTAVVAFTGAILDLGRAEPGDKTLVDALLPFRDELTGRLADGASLAKAWAGAALIASEAAAATSALRPKRGRARPLADKSVGTPDAGAASFSLIACAVGDLLAGGDRLTTDHQTNYYWTERTPS
ncbi:dihydroxyacetone kinase family protein [Leifsonia sp. NPDC056665]|uniref:dihydroxyacetone kinase family protein n=1 Tax=Leifsonia sp. NPDC056665 TaxID=3345901 RepID=UPI0036C3D214